MIATFLRIILKLFCSLNGLGSIRAFQEIQLLAGGPVGQSRGTTDLRGHVGPAGLLLLDGEGQAHGVEGAALAQGLRQTSQFVSTLNSTVALWQAQCTLAKNTANKQNPGAQPSPKELSARATGYACYYVIFSQATFLSDCDETPFCPWDGCMTRGAQQSQTLADTQRETERQRGRQTD
eukprot:scaffold329658_cov33-Prasinocladus_malaysianus.AAC.1